MPPADHEESAEMATPTSPTKLSYGTYAGSCHCGQVKFTVKTTPPIEEGLVTMCNCSICRRNGYLMIYPLDTNIHWISGKESMTPYMFGPERVAHSFCPKCGTSICAKSTDPNFFAENRAINVRTLADLDLDKLRLRKVDGKNK